MKYMVYIPSKGRAATAKLPSLLIKDEVDFRIVVGPEDESDYRKEYQDKVLVLPEGNMGLPYSRRWIKRYSEQKGESRHWQIDDDVWAYREYVPETRKHKKCLAGAALSYVEDLVDQYENIGAASTSTFSMFPKGPYVINRDVYHDVLVKNNTEHYWTDGTWEDTDFTLQNLASGLCTIVVQAFIHYIPSTAQSDKSGGGMSHEESQAGIEKRLRMIRTTQRRWPGLNIGIHRPKTFPKLMTKHVWKMFTQKPIRV